ncbi:MAG: RNA polymerase sigma factor [Candidatus Acidiferrales bacterium]
MARAREQADDDLLRRSIAGDENAFVLLYRRWQGPIFRFALHMSGSPSIAEDVTQEVFMTLVHGGSRFDPALGVVSGYLFGIARNQVRRRYEHDRLLVPLSEPGSGAPELNNGSRSNGTHPGPIVAPVDLSRGETIASVREAVLSLPGHYREVVVLCDLQEMSYEAAAGVLECAVGTVRSRLHRARAMLAAKLKEIIMPQPKSAAGRGATP